MDDIWEECGIANIDAVPIEPERVLNRDEEVLGVSSLDVRLIVIEKERTGFR